MKKLLVFLAALMLLTALALPVFAADSEVTFTSSGDLVYAGEEINVTVSISGDAPYTALGVLLNYDKQVFEYVGYEFGNTSAVFMDFSDGMLVATFDDNNTYAGNLLIVKLKVKTDAPFITTSITGQVSAKNLNDSVAITVKAAEITIGCRHNYTWVNTDDETHTGTCSACGDVKTEKHGWGDEGFNITPATCTEPGSETLECLLCHTQKTVNLDPKGHAWDNDCDPDCNNGCGETREAGHKYEEKFSSDEDKHWHACSVCGSKAAVAEHVPGTEATETTPQICTTCGYEIKPKLAHVHEFSDEWQQDDEYHWRICLKAGCYSRMDNGTHEYTDACDTTCDTCGHVRKDAPHQFGLEWKGSALGHWQDCLLCPTQSDVLPHNPGDPATEDTPQVCTECNFWLQYPLNHEHTLDDAWSMDDNNHWKYCTECSTRCEKAPHNWDEGIIQEEATETQNGRICYTCKDCEAIREELILATGTQTDPTETDPTAPTNPQSPNPSEKDEFPWWILIALAGVLLLTGIILFIIELIRSKKHNSRGKYSKEKERAAFGRLFLRIKSGLP